MEHARVEVLWMDAHSLTGGWTDVAELDREPRMIRSCGFLMSGVKPGHHVVVQSIDEDHVDGALAIPDQMVVEVRSLTVS